MTDRRAKGAESEPNTPTEIRESQLAELFVRVFGEDYDRAKFREVSNAQLTLGSRQSLLADQCFAEEISPDTYISGLDSDFASFRKTCEVVLGVEDTDLLCGSGSAPVRNIIDRDKLVEAIIQHRVEKAALSKSRLPRWLREFYARYLTPIQKTTRFCFRAAVSVVILVGFHSIISVKNFRQDRQQNDAAFFELRKENLALRRGLKRQLAAGLEDSLTISLVGQMTAYSFLIPEVTGTELFSGHSLPSFAALSDSSGPYSPIGGGLAASLDFNTDASVHIQGYIPMGKSARTPFDIYNVPEPHTYLMMLTGLAALGLAARRRSR